ncbi:MAG: CoA transferase [Candidatus Helarchaeota archaeon]|nr:CoA transferase [Candidatus Helarchaeota archaeon]
MPNERTLDGIRVLDLSQFISGPWGSKFLADQGAEVIKVEPPGFGEAMRMFIFFDKQIAPLFTIVNRNKKSITLNLRTPEAQEILKDLVKHVDVLLENFTPGIMEKWGIGYETLKKINPRLIYAAISGFGQTGPLRNRTAFDIIAQATSGVINAMQLDGPPGIPLADYSAGHLIALGIVEALYWREKSGKGQFIDLSMQDMMYAVNIRAQAREFIDRAKERELMASRWLPTYNQYPTKDGLRVAIVSITEKQFKNLMTLIGRPELTRDRRLKNPVKRMDNIEFLDEALETWTKSKTREEIIQILEENRIPCGPVMTIEEVHDIPQLEARGMYIRNFEFEDVEKATIPAPVLKFSETPGAVVTKGPALGEHNKEIYQDLLGISSEKFEQLRKKGII